MINLRLLLNFNTHHHDACNKKIQFPVVYYKLDNQRLVHLVYCFLCPNALLDLFFFYFFAVINHF